MSAKHLQDLSDAFDSIGHPIYNDEFLARVLAWACLSGFCEVCVTNEALHAVIMIAAKRFKIQGSMVPDFALIRKHWKPALEELREFGKATPWLRPLMNRYYIAGWEKLNYAEWAPEFEGKLTNDRNAKTSTNRNRKAGR